jgi:hypothetical protein
VQQRRRSNDLAVGSDLLGQPFRHSQHAQNVIEAVDRIVGGVPCARLLDRWHQAAPVFRRS